jgi:hypothetical protein
MTSYPKQPLNRQKSTFELNALFEHIFHNLELIITPKRRITTNHHKQNNPRTPNIALLPIALTQDLRRNIIRRAQPRIENLIGFLPDGYPEIDDLYEVGVQLEEHVLGLEVAVHHVLLVQVDQGTEDLFHYAAGELLGDLLGYDLFEELAALAQLEDQYVVGLVVVDLVQFGDVRMVQGHHDRHFLEQLRMFYFTELSFLDSFGCPVYTGIFGFDFMHAAKSASTNFFEDTIIFEIVSFFHLNECIPLNFDLF